MENFNKLNLKDGDIITEDKLAIIDSNTDKYNANKTEILNTLDSHTSQLNDIALIAPKGTGILETDTANLQKIIDSCNYNQKINISGTYKIGDIRIKSGTRIIGNNDCTIILDKPLDLSNSIEVKISEVKFTFNIDYLHDYCIILYKSHKFLFDKCKFRFPETFTKDILFFKGIETYYGRFNNCIFSGSSVSNGTGKYIKYGIACALTLFNSNIFNQCVFDSFKKSISIKNEYASGLQLASNGRTQGLTIDGCNFEHSSLSSVESENSISVNINNCYFETLFNQPSGTVAGSAINICNFIQFLDGTENCSVSNSFFASDSEIQTGFEAIKDIGNNNRFINNHFRGCNFIKIIENNNTHLLLNANSEFIVKDKDTDIPFDCILEGNASIITDNSYNLSFSTTTINTGVRYLFTPYKTSSNWCIALKLKSDYPFKIVFRRDSYNDTIKEFYLDCKGKEIIYVIDRNKFGASVSIEQESIYSVSILNNDTNGNKNNICCDYIKVYNSSLLPSENVIEPESLKSVTTITDVYTVSKYKYSYYQKFINDSLGSYINVIDGNININNNIINLNRDNAYINKEYVTNINEGEYLLDISGVGSVQNNYFGVGWSIPLYKNKFGEKRIRNCVISLDLKLNTDTLNSKCRAYYEVVDSSGNIIDSGQVGSSYSLRYYNNRNITISLSEEAEFLKIWVQSFQDNIVKNKMVFKNINIKINNNDEFIYSDSAPTTGFHLKNEIIKNLNHVAGGYEKFVCITTGTPGVWKGVGMIES